MAQRGGRRPGAGRKPGSTTRPQIRDYMTADEIRQLIADIKEAAKTDNMLKKWLGEQVFGKATQHVEVEDKRMLILDDDEPEGDSSTV